MAPGEESEAWRGEGQRPLGVILQAFFGGQAGALSPEERERVDGELRRRRDEAAARALVLPAYSRDARCTNCGGVTIKVRYCPGGTDNSDVFVVCYRDTAGQEHLHRVCDGCGYAWCEKTLDAGAGA